MDLSRRTCQRHARGSILERVDIYSTTTSGCLRPVFCRFEELNLLTQCGSEVLARHVGSSDGEMLVQSGQETHGNRLAQVGGGINVGLGEFSVADAVGESWETVYHRHRRSQATVSAGRGGSKNCGDLNEVLGEHIVVDPT
ncbi:hypothetical protein [Brevibacterium antiquum]|uniref:hypothetical protein n=1 Tax=Brevibacterium antiquum TaxID=234835 RepID=UPI00142D2104|nr:hypothetical protein [Brevibacterium antiquum]